MLSGRRFALKLGQAVRFNLLASSRGNQPAQQRQPQGQGGKPQQEPRQPQQTKAEASQGERKQQRQERQPRAAVPATAAPQAAAIEPIQAAAAPVAERPQTPPTAEAPKDTTQEAVIRTTDVDAGEAAAPSTEGGQSRRRRGRRGGRRRRRHEDGAPAGAAGDATQGQGKDAFDFDDEDRGDAAPAIAVPLVAAAVAAGVEAASAPLAESSAAPMAEARIAPAPVAAEPAPEAVLSAVAPASFNLPALPPIPEKTAEADVQETVTVEAAATQAHEAPAAIHDHAVEAHETVPAAPVALTADVTASAAPAPEALPAAEQPAPIVAHTTVDFRSHIETVAHAEPAPAPIAEVTVQAATADAGPVAQESDAPTPLPAQGDLLAHAGVATPAAPPAEAEGTAADEHADTVKKDASHG